MRRQFALATLLAACSLPVIAQGTDPNLARNLAASCANCHNTNGRSVASTAVIAGQPKEILVKALRDFKEDKRPATIMHQLTKGYTDEQIDLIAAYFAAQK